MYNITVMVGDRTGRVLTELKPGLSTIPWRLNEISRVDLTLSKKDDKANQTNLRHGNRIFIRFSSDLGLPDWGGVLDPPTEWDSSTVKVSAYTIEYLLQFRQTGKTRAFIDKHVGTIFNRVIREAEQEQSLGMRVGVVWNGGRLHSQQYHYKSVWSIITDSIQKLETCDVIFAPKLENGYIKFVARLFEKAGTDKSAHFTFREGQNVSEAALTEQGPIINQFAAAGSGTTWGDDRKTAVSYSIESDQVYGLRQSSKVYPNVTLQTTLTRNAAVEIRDNAQPHTRIALRVVNLDPAKFARYHIGDTIQCVLPNFGWGGYNAPVRVLSREYDPQRGDCVLIVEEDKFVAPVNIGLTDLRTEE